MSHENVSIEMNRRKQTFCSKNDEAKFKIILVGDSSVGKTSLFLAFTDDDHQDKSNPTVTAVDFRLQPLQINGQLIKLHIWDTAGQQRYRSLVQSFFKGCQGAVIVFDLSQKSSFIHATTEWFKICSGRVNHSQIILIGNKSDLEQKVSQKQIQQWTQKNGVQYFQVSVKNLQKIQEPFISLSKKMITKKKAEIKIKNSFLAKQNPNGSQDIKTKLKNSKRKENNKKKIC